MLEHAHFVVARALARVFDAINQIACNFRNTSAEHGIGQALDERNATSGVGCVDQHQVHCWGKRTHEAGQHDKTVAAFETGVAGGHSDS